MNKMKYYAVLLSAISICGICVSCAMEKTLTNPNRASGYHSFSNDHIQVIKSQLDYAVPHKEKIIRSEPERIPMFVALNTGELLLPSNWHTLTISEPIPKNDPSHHAFSTTAMVCPEKDGKRILRIPFIANQEKRIEIKHLEKGELLLDGPNEQDEYICGNNTITGQSLCLLIKPNIYGTQPQIKFHVPKQNHFDTLVAVALGNKRNFALATKNNLLLYSHTDTSWKQECPALSLPEQLKKIAFITASTLICLAESGTLYICWKDKDNKDNLKIALQKEYGKILTFALDPLHPYQMVFMKKDYNYDDPIFFCNLKERTSDGKIPYFRLNQQSYNNPQHDIEGLWFYNDVIGLLSKVQSINNLNPHHELLRYHLKTYINKKQFLEYVNTQLNSDSATRPS